MAWLQRWLRTPEAELCRRFVETGSEQVLEELLRHFAASAPGSLPSDAVSFREALGKIQNWTVDPPLLRYLRKKLESDLLAAADHRPEDWKTWLNIKRALGEELTLDSPSLVSALVSSLADTEHSHHFTPLDRRAVIDAIAAFALRTLQDSQNVEAVDTCRAVSVLAALIDSTSLGKEGAVAIQNWWHNVPSRLRSLECVPDADALAAPTRGAGSPNGVALTAVHTRGSAQPIRVLCAGRTPDRLINSWIDEALFAAALCCDTEPTILSGSGAILSIAASDESTSHQRSEPLLSAVLGPAGPIEPTGRASNLGLTAAESLVFLRDTFKRLETTTGLVQTTTWDSADGDALDAAIREATLAQHDRRLTSDPAVRSEGATLHAFQCLHRRPSREWDHISIEVPYGALGVDKLFRLIRAGRTCYVDGLLRDAKRRESVARQAKLDHQRRVEAWKALGADGQESECRRLPEVSVTHQYDFRLGRAVRLRVAKRIPRREYEEQVCPSIVTSATEFEEQFRALASKLDDLNKPGGRADILTLKILVDCALRDARLPASAERFSNEFEAWSNIAGPAIWANVVAWCTLRGYPLEELSRDNVCFNVRVNWKRGTIALEPWAFVDLHDYSVSIAEHLAVRSGSRLTSLQQTVVSDATLGVTDGSTLHQTFVDWMKKHVYPLTISPGEYGGLPSDFELGPQRVAALFELAKALFIAGQWDSARHLISQIRAADEAPIYFLGALTTLAGSAALRQRSEYAVIERVDDPAARAQQECALALAFVLGGRDYDLLPSESRRYLQQVVSKDSRFLGSVKHDRIGARAVSELRVTGSEDAVVEYVKAAAGALELFRLAEEASATALGLDTFGSLSGAVRRELTALCDRADRLVFARTPDEACFGSIRERLL